MKIILAITGASGSIYGRMVIERLIASPQVERIAMIVSRCGSEVIIHEEEAMPCGEEKLEVFDGDDMFAPVASGSACYDAMVVVPCSMGTLARIAAGVSDSLICRAADVMLKERRKLILVPRETPINTIHLRNMLTLSECGAIILPAMPSFYSRPKDIEAICNTVVERIMSQLGVDTERFIWGEKKF